MRCYQKWSGLVWPFQALADARQALAAQRSSRMPPYSVAIYIYISIFIRQTLAQAHCSCRGYFERNSFRGSVRTRAHSFTALDIVTSDSSL
jgi:hypothetical protein